MNDNNKWEEIAQQIQDLYFEAGAIVDINTWNKTKALITQSRLADLDREIEAVGGMKVLHQKFENNTGKLHCDPVTEICEITAYNSACDYILTRLTAQRESIIK